VIAPEILEKYMRRCLQLAALGLGSVQPNPMVGAVIVKDDYIIGEGYHQRYGEAHAEVNAINSVKQPELLKESTLYVNLEPCSHFGKTPPCVDKIIACGIPRVVVGVGDPHAKVNGRGIATLREAGVDVMTYVLKEECTFANRRFFTFHCKQRPYIILKWAQTADGRMDIDRILHKNESYWITNDEMRVLVHKWRSEEQAILIGYSTYQNDKPALTTRYYTGKSPARFIMTNNIEKSPSIEGFTFLPENIEEALQTLYNASIQSIIIEGGKKTLARFMDANCWDEARVLSGRQQWGSGLEAPQLPVAYAQKMVINDNIYERYFNDQQVADLFRSDKEILARF